MGCAPGLFSIDHDGILRTLGSFQEQEGVVYELKVSYLSGSQHCCASRN